MLKRHDYLGDIVSIAGIIVLLSVAALVVGLIVGEVMNENNRIDSGVIVNKYMDNGYTRFRSDKGGSHYHNDPPSYHFTIEGKKDGETVQYTFEVNEEDYNSYKIGDQYNR